MAQEESLTKGDVERIVERIYSEKQANKADSWAMFIGNTCFVGMVLVFVTTAVVLFHQQARRDLGEWLLKKPAAVAEMEELRTKVDDCDDRAKYANLYLSNLNNRLKALESTKHAPNCPDGKCCPDCKCDVKPEVEK